MQYLAQRYPVKGIKHKWILAGLAGLVMAGLLAAYWASSGNQGQIMATPQAPAAEAVADKFLNGKYVSFTYSGEYQAQNQPAKDSDLELYMLRADTNYDKALAVSVSQLPNGNLDNDSSYLLRKSQPNTYSKSPVEVDGSPAVVWAKADGSEETVFIPHGNSVAVLAFTTASPSDHLGPEVSAVLGTFRWKQ